jgi:hypothetical protein
MTNWTAVVIGLPEPETGPMVSRLPSYLHPVAGRPLVWHTVNALRAVGPEAPAARVVAAPEIPGDLFDGTGVEVLPHALDHLPEEQPARALEIDGTRIVAIHASASLDPENLRRLLAGDEGIWIGDSDDGAAAVRVTLDELDIMLRQSEPFSVASGTLDPSRRIGDTGGSFVVRSRSDLARAHLRTRDRLIRNLMEAGVTFILPETVAVDVDVRVGRDTVVYPGVVLEGQTTVGEETVIGPGCRIVDSWVGSGVELKGWNYISHTSVRNRAILEPYVRRGFD